MENEMRSILESTQLIGVLERDNKMLREENARLIREKQSLESIENSLSYIQKSIDNELSQKPCFYCGYYYQCKYKRDDCRLSELIEKARRRVFVFATSLSDLTEPLSYIRDALKESPDLDIKILALKPTSIFIKMRYSELHYDTPERFFNQLTNALDEVHRIRDDIKGQYPNCSFEIKTHLHTPNYMFYLIDDHLYINPIVAREEKISNRNNPHFYFRIDKIDNDSVKKSVDIYIESFDYCWRTAEDSTNRYTYNDTWECFDIPYLTN